MAGIVNDVLYGLNADFTGGNSLLAAESNGLFTNGQMWIGSTAVNAGGTHINVGTFTSPGGSITIGYSSPNITLSVSGATVAQTITGNSGGALSPTAGNFNLLGTGSITTSGAASTLTTQLTGLTNHAILVGAGTATITKLGLGTAGQVLQSGGASADPVFSTATYPTTAGTSGNVLTSDGTNWTSAAAAGGTLLTVSGTLTSLQIKSLSGTPIQIIAAPGVGSYIQIISMTSRLNYGGTNAFTNAAGGSIVCAYGTYNTNMPVLIGNTVITATATTTYFALPPIDAFPITAVATTFDNVAINIYYNIGGFNVAGNAANNNTISYKLTYIIVTI